MPKWNTGIIDKIVDLAEAYRYITLRTEESHRDQFKPGQFITMDLPIGQKRLERWRSYSIANRCQDNIIELCISRVPQGRASNYLFDQINVGTPIVYKGPLGAFVLPIKLPPKLIMICTGTGVAPFRSMIQSIVEMDERSTEVHLVFGTRIADNILFQAEFEQLERQYPWFHYHVALSREEYKNYRGYVHNLYEAISIQGVDDVKYYLCGWQNMIDEAIQKLSTDMNIDKKNIYFELYG